MANAIDRLILAIAPERGLARINARTRAHALMNYDAATYGARAPVQKAPATDADTASRFHRARLRQVARELVRNREFAARAQTVIAGHVVGAGIVPSIEAEDQAVKDSATLLVNRHLLSKSVDTFSAQSLLGLQGVVAKTVVIDGEIFVRRRWRTGAYRGDLPLPFQIELIEADQLDTARTSYGENEVVDGIEIGPTGAPVAYHFLKTHPGKGTSVFRRGSRETTRVTADDVLHIRRPDRPGQLRGVSWFAPVALKLAELQDYQEAEIVKQKMAALLAGIISGGDGTSAKDGPGLAELAPGMMVRLGTDEDVTFTSPPTVTSYDPFMRAGLRAIAAGLGITYEAFTGDLTGINYTGFRAGRVEMDRNVETWQKRILIEQFCDGVSRWFSEAWRLDPRNETVEGWTLIWTPPKKPMVDPTKEIPAAIKEIDAGLTSRQRKQRELGLDPDVVAAERVEDETRAGAPVSKTTPKEGKTK